MVKRLSVAILLLPVAEIAVFVLVAALIGFGRAFTLMVVTSVAGFLVLRQGGRGGIARLRAGMARGGEAATEADAAGSLLTVLAGLLLLLPGFLTDLLGAALLIGPVRRRIGQQVQRWIRRGRPQEPSVIDLAPGEWQQVPERELQDSSHPARRR